MSKYQKSLQELIKNQEKEVKELESRIGIIQIKEYHEGFTIDQKILILLEDYLYSLKYEMIGYKMSEEMYKREIYDYISGKEVSMKSIYFGEKLHHRDDFLDKKAVVRGMKQRLREREDYSILDAIKLLFI